MGETHPRAAMPSQEKPKESPKLKRVKKKKERKVTIEDTEGAMKAIADIRVKVEHGATVDDINAAFESHQYPDLENAESQMAMVSVIEKVGQSAIVHEVLAQECTGKKEVDLEAVGLKAFVSTLASNSTKVDEIITQFEP